MTRAPKPAEVVTAPSRPRTPKTPAQRAQEALDVASRRVQRLRDVRDDLAEQLKVSQADLEAATRRRDHLAKDPDLPPQPAEQPAP